MKAGWQFGVKCLYLYETLLCDVTVFVDMRPVACCELTRGGGLGSGWSCNVNPISLSPCNELRLWLLTGESLCVKALIEAFKMAHPKEFTIPFTPTHAR